MNFKKIFYIFLVVFCSLLILAFLFISPITKYIIEKNSEEWIGRKLKIEKLWINIFAGSLHIENFKMYENKNDKVFVSFADFYCNIEINKLFAGEYAVSPISLSKPVINIIQTGSRFNFDDIMKRFADTTQTKPDLTVEPVKYFIENFSISSGVVNYSTSAPATSISIININATTLPIAFTDSIYNIKSDFSFKTGGKINTLLNFNTNSMAYSLKFKAQNHKLSFLAEYLKDYMKVKSFDAWLNTDLNISGNLNKPQEVAASGMLDVNNFSIIDTTGERLASFAEYKMGIDTINTKEGIYNFKYILLDQLYLKFGIYNDGTNFDRVLVEETVDSTSGAPLEEYSNVFQMMAGYIKSLSTEYLLNEYHVEKLSLKNGHIFFTDYTLEDKFQYDLDSMNLGSENLNSKNERINIALACRLNKSGLMSGTLSINPDGFEDMEIYYLVKDLLITDINPYSKYYVATPFINGKILYENKTTIVDNQLKSINKLFIEKIKVGSKTRSKGLYDLPVKLAVTILRDPKGNIDLEIPVEGDLNDPSYKIGKVIWAVFKNLIIKAVKAPFSLIANAFGGKEEDYKEIRFEYLQRSVTEDQEKILGNLVKLLNGKPDLGIEFVQLNNKDDEIEQLGLFTIKKQFLGFSGLDSLNDDQLKQIVELSNKDSIFIRWVDNTMGTQAGLTSIQEKCIRLIGKEKLLTEVDSIMEQRNNFLSGYFIDKGISAERIKITDLKGENQATREAIPRYLVNLFN